MPEPTPERWQRDRVRPPAYAPRTYQPPPFGPPLAPPRRSRIPMVIAGAAGVLALVGIAGSAAGFVEYTGAQRDLRAERTAADQLRQQAVSDTRRVAAQKAACDFLGLATNYEAAKLDQFVPAILNVTTTQFGKEFASPAVLDLIKSIQGTSKALETHCGLEVLNGQHATVVAVVKQATSNANNPEPVIRVATMSVSVEEQPDGKWLVSSMSSATT